MCNKLLIILKAVMMILLQTTSWCDDIENALDYVALNVVLCYISVPPKLLNCSPFSHLTPCHMLNSSFLLTMLLMSGRMSGEPFSYKFATMATEQQPLLTFDTLSDAQLQTDDKRN